MYRKYGKRLMDIIISGISLVLLSPVILVTAVMVRIKLGDPVIFKQKRPGLNEKIFELYKFRTMTNAVDKNGNLLPDSERLTGFGRFLRSSSLDELPELVNILKGDMSIVGPRPLLVRYLDRYDDTQRHRHDVRPGLTGLAQINGRNLVNWAERFEYDLKYIEDISFVRDLKILVKTVSCVLSKKGISSGTSETMEEFMGNNQRIDKKTEN